MPKQAPASSKSQRAGKSVLSKRPVKSKVMANGKKTARPAHVVVDGKKLLQNDPREQDALAKALEKKMPVVLENSSSELTASLTGAGVDSEVVVLKPEGNRITLALTEETKPATGTAQGRERGVETGAKDLKVRGGNPGKSSSEARVVPSAAQEAGVEEQVEAALLAFGTEAPTTAMAAGGREEATPWHFSSKVELPRRTFTIDDTFHKKKQVFAIRVDMQYDLYAATNPAHKYLVVKLLGSGFSAGDMVIDQDHDRSYFQYQMQALFGPSLAYKGMAIDEHYPKNKNQDGSWTVTSGFEVGAALNASWPPGLEVSASYNRSSSASVNLQEFDVINQSNDTTGNFIYKMAMMEGVPVNDSSIASDLDKTKPKQWRIRRVPQLAKTLLTPRCEVVWRFPHNFDQTIKMHVQLYQWIRYIYRGTADYWHRKHFGPNTVDTTFDIDMSRVQVPKKPEAAIPQFAARVLVEYKPEPGEVFMLRSLGDGAFEILDGSTVQIPPKQGEPVLAYHTVKQGDMLSSISLRYYGSAERSKWMQIYEANWEVMGSNYNNVRPGMVLKIPYLRSGGGVG
jgi:hypothetical protein